MVNEEVTHLFKALSHPIRVDILDLLKKGPLSTGEVSEHFDVSRYAVMKHLKILEDVHLIVIRRQSRTRLNFLNIIPLQEMYNRWVSKYESKLSTSLTSLKTKLEAGGTKRMKLDISSFQIEQQIDINAPLERVFHSLVNDINDWWEFRFEENNSHITFDSKIGGLFMENWEDGQGAIWGTVLYYKENEEIRLQGLLGMQGAVNSHYGYRLESNGESTTVKLSHSAVGLLDPNWEEAHSNGWSLLLNNLKIHVEKP
ncbi:helix-turn-helix domain-containing protein [Paenisporosarcina sp. OV554]|uniref:ArsR/SmtB family transcription factor n=1 Tax=Paenisporosarcina sp. OV554 TaxID=2135694 RepID=UPI000D3334AE|nr:helix-turn-helix domain-containing protein [Paenisporosarcina sp. OV554]PUB16727.1 ArsR family transcriptional regulator [Paenisporosarcina sp. OV554]